MNKIMIFLAALNVGLYPLADVFVIIYSPYLWATFIFCVWSVFIVYRSIEFIKREHKSLEVKNDGN